MLHKRPSIWRNLIRWGSTNEGLTNTHVILLHFGHPRTEFYARESLETYARHYYNLPSSWPFKYPAWMLTDKIRNCITSYDGEQELEELSEKVDKALASALTSIFKDDQRISCSSAFLLRQPSIKDAIQAAMSSNAHRIVFLPMSAHFHCSQSGLLLNAAARALSELTIPARNNVKCRIQPQTSRESDVSAIDRWSVHPVVSSHWCSLLEKAGKFDAIVFAAPAARGYGRSEFRNAVWASCERVMAEYNSPVPWRLGFFDGWHEWSIPQFHSLSWQLRHFKDRRVAVVPISHLVPSFDTLSVLPNILRNNNGATLVQPSATSLLIQGMAEVVRNHLLGRRTGQLTEYCTGCIKKDCQATRSIFA